MADPIQERRESQFLNLLCGLRFDEVDGDGCCLINTRTYLFIETIAMILKILIVGMLTSSF